MVVDHLYLGRRGDLGFSMNALDPTSHAIGHLQASLDALRVQQVAADAEAEARHARVMAALDALSNRVMAVEGVVKLHAEQLTSAESLVKEVDRLKQRGAGVLLVIVAAWGGIVGAAAFFKAELIKWWFS